MSPRSKRFITAALLSAVALSIGSANFASAKNLYQVLQAHCQHVPLRAGYQSHCPTYWLGCFSPREQQFRN